MGIKGLWKLLEPAAQVCTLNDISPGHSATNGRNVACIGVDISVIMNECIAAYKNGTHLYQQKSEGALRIFFFKLCKFLRQAPAIMVFVFDGFDRPSFKHGRNIDTHTIPTWSNQCKRIIESFGFYWRQAPGEADAELAMLSRRNDIDAILTNDSDCLVFGAQCIIKYIPKSGDKYLLYSMDAIETALSLSHGGLLLIALLSKGDYSDGLAGCGPAISGALARCGFGDQILKAIRRLEDIKLRKELDGIVLDIQAELHNNSSGFLNSRYPLLAVQFSAEIIAPEKISTYFDPLVSPQLPSIPNWIAKEPSIPQIGQFCVQTLNWAPGNLETQLNNVLWSGVFLRMLTSPLLVYNNETKLCLTPNSQAQILSAPIRTRVSQPGNWARVEFSTANFVAQLTGGGYTQYGAAIRRKMKSWLLPKYLPLDLQAHPQPESIPPDHLSSAPSTPSVTNAPGPSSSTLRLDSKKPNSGLGSVSRESSASSLDPPLVQDLFNSARLPRASTSSAPHSDQLPPNARGSGTSVQIVDVIEITDSESDSEVEIVRSFHKRAHSEAFSLEIIVISD